MTWANFMPWYFLAVMMDHLIGVMYASIGRCRLNQPIGGCGRANGRDRAASVGGLFHFKPSVQCPLLE